MKTYLSLLLVFVASLAQGQNKQSFANRLEAPGLSSTGNVASGSSYTTNDSTVDGTTRLVTLKVSSSAGVNNLYVTNLIGSGDIVAAGPDGRLLRTNIIGGSSSSNYTTIASGSGTFGTLSVTNSINAGVGSGLAGSVSLFASNGLQAFKLIANDQMSSNINLILPTGISNGYLRVTSVNDSNFTVTFDTPAGGSTTTNFTAIWSGSGTFGAVSVTNGVTSATATISTLLLMGAGAPISFNSLSRITTATDGFLTLLNSAQTDFLGLRLGGTSAGSPMLGKTNGDFIVTGANGLDPGATNRLFVPGGIDVTRTNVLQAVPLAHFGTNVANGLTVRTNGTVQLDSSMLFGTDNTYDIGAIGANRPQTVWAGSVRSSTFEILSGTAQGVRLTSAANGVIRMEDVNTLTGLNRLQLGGTTAAFPAIGRTNGDLIVLGADGGASFTNRLHVPGGIVISNADVAIGKVWTAVGANGGGSWSNAPASGSSGPTTNAPPFTLALSGTGSTNIIIDMSALGPTNHVRTTLTANAAVVFTNVIDGKTITLEAIQDSTGNRTLGTNNPAYPLNMRYGIDVTSLSTITNATWRDLFRFVGSGTNALVVGNIRGFAP